MRLPSRYAQRHDVKKSASHVLGIRAVFLHDAVLLLTNINYNTTYEIQKKQKIQKNKLTF